MQKEKFDTFDCIKSKNFSWIENKLLKIEDICSPPKWQRLLCRIRKGSQRQRVKASHPMEKWVRDAGRPSTQRRPKSLVSRGAHSLLTGKSYGV